MESNQTAQEETKVPSSTSLPSQTATQELNATSSDLPLPIQPSSSSSSIPDTTALIESDTPSLTPVLSGLEKWTLARTRSEQGIQLAMDRQYEKAANQLGPLILSGSLRFASYFRSLS